MAICSYCEGTGKRVCFKCIGRGYTTELNKIRAAIQKIPFGQEQICFNCGSSGKVTCHYCGGTGKAKA